MKRLICTIAALASIIPAFAQGSVEQSKTVKDNLDGTYTLTLETYVTGQKVANPLDIVLVLDNSNSMYSYDIGKNSHSSGGTYRADALKSAVAQFIDNIYNNGETPAHRMAIVKFEGGGRRIDHYVNYKTENPDLTHATDICGGWVEMNATDISAAKTAVNNMKKSTTDTGTPSAEGLALAYNLLTADDIKNDGRQKVVVFFTDGCCGTGETWAKAESQYPSSNPTIYGYPKINNVAQPLPNRYYAPVVVEAANELKKIATIYSVGAFGDLSDNEQKGDTYFYMRHVSSTYNTAIRVDGNVPTTPLTGQLTDVDAQMPSPVGEDGYLYTQPFHTVNEGDRSLSLEGDKYVFDSSNPADLKAAFDAISKEIVETVDLTAEATVILDVLTDQFSFLKDFSENNVSLYTCSANTSLSTLNWATTGTGGITVHKDKDNNVVDSKPSDGHDEYWAPWTPWTTTGKIQDYIKINPATNVTGTPIRNDYIEVTGYDFKTNYVGLDGNHYRGQKLIVQFTLQADPSNKGGLGIRTNEEISGVYAKDDSKPSGFRSVVPYDRPVVYLPYIKIVKKGLALGESATFRITKVTSADGSTVDNAYTAYSANVIVTKTKADEDPCAVLKLVYSGYYKVEETSWSTWAYKVTKYDADNDGTPETEGKAYTRQMNTVGTFTDANRFLTFTFENSNAAGTQIPEHGESYVINNMGVSHKATRNQDSGIDNWQNGNEYEL